MSTTTTATLVHFTKEGFSINSGYVTFHGQFVARFKYKPSNAKDFVKFLINHFTPVEYFGRLNAGESPLEIAKSKGYVLPHLRTILKKAGFPVTPEGLRSYLSDSTYCGHYNSRVSNTTIVASNAPLS